jgi:hypothetical protein
MNTLSVAECLSRDEANPTLQGLTYVTNIGSVVWGSNIGG